MSFRVKTTHPILQNNPVTKPQEKNARLFFEVPDDEKTYLTQPYLSTTEKKTQQENRPKGSSGKGMAVRTITAAQSDHM